MGPCLVAASILFAQGTDLGTIRGAVTDFSGAVVPNAAVEVTDAVTNAVHKVITDATGTYEASSAKIVRGPAGDTVARPGSGCRRMGRRDIRRRAAV